MGEVFGIHVAHAPSSAEAYIANLLKKDEPGEGEERKERT
jgi:hypothetical protein